MTPLRTLAHLFERTESETAAGGRTVVWEPLGHLWLALSSAQRSGDAAADLPPVTRERRLADSRFDPRITAGMRVDAEGAEWRVVLVDRDAPRIGRMTLTLERHRP